MFSCTHVCTYVQYVITYTYVTTYICMSYPIDECTYIRMYMYLYIMFVNNNFMQFLLYKCMYVCIEIM